MHIVDCTYHYVPEAQSSIHLGYLQVSIVCRTGCHGCSDEIRSSVAFCCGQLVESSAK